MNAMGTWSGWIVAAALAVAAVVRVASVEKDVAVEPGKDASVPAVAPKERKAPRAIAAQQGRQAPAEAEPNGDAAMDGDGVEAGDEWAPPGDIDSIEGIYAFLANSTPQERDLGRRLLAAYKAGDRQALLAAAREALNCPDPKVCAMAIKAMGETDDMPQPDTAELLLGFSAHENAYVKNEAVRVFADCIGDAGEGETMSLDTAIDLSVMALKTLDFSNRRNDFALVLAWEKALGAQCMDVAAIDKAATAFGDLAKSDDEEMAKLGRWALSNIVSPDFVWRDGALYDDATIDSMLDEKRGSIAEAAALFPDNQNAAARYLRICRGLSETAKERFGDDAAAAAAWIAEEKEFAARKIAERAKDDAEAAARVTELEMLSHRRISGGRAWLRARVNAIGGH